MAVSLRGRDAAEPRMPEAGLEPRRGPSGAPIARVDPWQLRLIPRVFDPSVAAPRRLAIGFPHGPSENLMFAAVLRALRERLPTTEFVMLVSADVAAAEMWRVGGLVAGVGILPATPAERAEAAHRAGADAFVLSAGRRLSGALARGLGFPYAQRVFAAEFGVAPDTFRYEIAVEERDRSDAARLFDGEAGPVVALDATASGDRRWPRLDYERTARLLAARGFRVFHCAEAFAGRSIPFRAAVLERCAAVVALDSPTMHVAAALGKPTVGYFAPATSLSGHTFEATHALLVGRPNAEQTLRALERLLGGLERPAPSLSASRITNGRSSDRDALDVIVATFNEERNLPRLLASLAANGLSPGAITIVDKGSTDGTAAIARAFGARLLGGGRNSSEQRNIGADATSRPFLAFLDADMELVPGQIAEWLRLLERFRCLTIPEVSIPIDRLGRARSLERSFIGANPEIESARVFAREVFERAGGYRVDLYGCEDWALSDIVVGSHPSGRGSAAIRHHEGRLTTPQLFSKYRRYGRGYFALLLENRRRFVRHARPLRGAMLAAIVAAGRRNPGLLLSWLQFRTITYAGGLVGFVEAAVARGRGRE